MQLKRNGRRLLLGVILGAGAWLGWMSDRPAQAEPGHIDRVDAVRSRSMTSSLAAPAEAPRAAPSPTFHVPEYKPRDPSEWQGMLVDTGLQAPCAAPDGCGLAMACHQGRCGPCTSDAECAAGESCSLDHCVRSDLAGCRARRDCAAGEFCVLSGYSADPRGNGEMRASCLAAAGGRSDTPQEQTWTPIQDGWTPVPVDSLLESLDKVD
jgi:hypothetical protein